MALPLVDRFQVLLGRLRHRRALLFPIVLGTVLVAWAAESESFDQPEVEPIAWVNDEEVSLERFNSLLVKMLERLRLSGEVPDGLALRLKANLTDQLIDERCLERVATEKGIEVGEAEVDEVFEQFSARFESPEDFERFLRTYVGGETELRHRLRLQRMGDELLEQSHVPVSEEFLRELYEGNPGRFQVPAHLYAQEILLRVGSEDSPEYREAQYAKARELVERARSSGTSFSMLAMGESEGDTARIGGDLGRVTAESVAAPLWEALSSLEPGAVSGVVETEQGFHILKLLERRPAYRPELEEVREFLRAEVEEATLRARRADLARELRERCVIINALAERYAEPLAEISAPVGPLPWLEWSLQPGLPPPSSLPPGVPPVLQPHPSSRQP